MSTLNVFPKREVYLGIIIGNGYLIGPAGSFIDGYTIMCEAAQNGDERAREIMARIPVTDAETRVYYRTHKYNDIPKLKKLADNGSWLAMRQISHHFRQRMKETY
jgi:hypothetical protein